MKCDFSRNFREASLVELYYTQKNSFLLLCEISFRKNLTNGLNLMFNQFKEIGP